MNAESSPCVKVSFQWRIVRFLKDTEWSPLQPELVSLVQCF